MVTELVPEPLTCEAFAPFGDVIDVQGERRLTINNGTTIRYDALARVDAATHGGHGLINIFRTEPLALPLTILMMEKHPIGSQAFMPIRGERFLVVVAPPGDTVAPADLRAFIAESGQGVSYARDTWHHPVIAMDRQTDFLVIDRGGPGNNLVEFFFPGDQPVSRLTLQP